MSIADKISSIEEHLQADWESIENIGGTAEDKNIENIASVVNGIYDNLPKTTGESSNLSLTTLKGKMNIIPKGDTSQNGTPTPSTPIDIEVVTGTQTITISNSDNTETQTQIVSLGDIELCKIGNYQDYIYKTSGKNKCNITSTEGWVYSAGLPDSTNTSIVIDSFDSNSIQYHSNTNAYLEVLTNQIQLKPNTQYTITFNRTSTATNNQFFIYNYTQGSGYSINFRDNNQNVFEKTFTTDSNGIIALGFGFGNVTGTAKVSNIMLVEGSTASVYEPYGSGNWYKKEQIYNYEFLDNDNWVETDNHLQGCYTVYKSTPKKTQSSTYTPYCTNLIGVNGPNYGSQATANSIGVSGDRFNVYIPSATTTNVCKSTMAEQKVYYVLATVNDIQITNSTLIEQLDNLEKLKSYNGVTNISSSGNLSAILGVSALKGE